MSEVIAQKLDEARALIEKGWVQNTFSDGLYTGAPRYCPVGAIHAVTPVVGQEWETRDSALRALSDAIGVDGYSSRIILWNDKKERTQAEVVEAFLKSSQLTRARASMSHGEKQ